MNNNKTRTILIILAVVLALTAVLLGSVVAWLLTNRQGGSTVLPSQGQIATVPSAATQPTGDSETTPTASMPEAVTDPVDTTVPTENPEDFLINTPYGDLRYPGEWADFLEVKQEGDVFTFIAHVTDTKVQPLFTLTFGGTIAQDALGVLVDDADNLVALRVESHTFTPDDSWSDREASIVFTMMDHLNYVLTHLPLEPVPQETAPTVPEETDREAMGIDTQWCQIMYPAQWAGNLSLEFQDHYVRFFCVNAAGEKLELFTLGFNLGEGTEVKTIRDYQGNSVSVTLQMHELKFDSTWTEAERSLAYNMQEDVNFLIQRLP